MNWLKRNRQRRPAPAPADLERIRDDLIDNQVAVWCKTMIPLEN